MALNTRRMFDPRWVFHHRPVVEGSMLGKIELYSVNGMETNGVLTWNPYAINEADREPQDPQKYAGLYKGEARIQPIQAFRSRKQEFDAQVVTEYAATFQIPLFGGNEWAPNTPLPSIDVGDAVTVTKVDCGYDTQLTKWTYVIRAIVSGSNHWVRTFLADIVQDNAGGPYGR